MCTPLVGNSSGLSIWPSGLARERFCMETNVRKSGRMLHRACAIALAGALSFGAVGSLYAEPPAVAAVEQASENFALGATATASAQEANTTPATGVNDGHNDRDHRWSSGTACPKKDENTWIQLAFKQPVTIGQVRVTFEQRTADPNPSNVKAFDIQVKTQDGGGMLGRRSPRYRTWRADRALRHGSCTRCRTLLKR